MVLMPSRMVSPVCAWAPLICVLPVPGVPVPTATPGKRVIKLAEERIAPATRSGTVSMAPD